MSMREAECLIRLGAGAAAAHSGAGSGRALVAKLQAGGRLPVINMLQHAYSQHVIQRFISCTRVMACSSHDMFRFITCTSVMAFMLVALAHST